MYRWPSEPAVQNVSHPGATEEVSIWRSSLCFDISWLVDKCQSAE